MATPLLLPLLVSFLWLCTIFNCGLSETYYVEPSANGSCHQEGVSCRTLSQYANMSHDFFNSNTTLILLPGNHSLDLELVISNITHLTISASLSGNTNVMCSLSARFNLTNVGHIHISGIDVFGCMGSSVTSVDHFELKNCLFDGGGRGGSAIDVEFVVNVFIVNSKFTSNSGGLVDIPGYGIFRSGGAVVIKNNTNISISSCLFSDNVAEYGGAVYAVGSNNVLVHNSRFSSNVAVYAGGAIVIMNSTVYVSGSVFIDNIGGVGDLGIGGGGIAAAIQTDLKITNSTFINNIGPSGGAVMTTRSSLTLGPSIFINNTASIDGGALSIGIPIDAIIESTFVNNTCINIGGAVSTFDSMTSVIIINSTFTDNEANIGGALYTFNATAIIDNSKFVRNIAVSLNIGNGGAVYTFMFSLTLIRYCVFINNTAYKYGAGITTACSIGTIVEDTTLFNNVALLGGAFYGTGGSSVCQNEVFPSVELVNTNFTYNIAPLGASLYVESVDFLSRGYLIIQQNFGNVYLLKSTVYCSGHTSISNNYGSLYSFSSNVSFSGVALFTNNRYYNHTYSKIFVEEGGAVTSLQSEIHFTGTVHILNNTAGNGGGILATESNIRIHGNTTVTVAGNSVSLLGGGIYAYHSELNFGGNVTISQNVALSQGGGVYALGSTVRLTQGSLTLVKNFAKEGGGVCLEMNSKVYIIKSEPECLQDEYLCNTDPRTWLRLEFIGNSADYGGAIYISDKTDSGICASTPFKVHSTISECFFQVLALHSLTDTSNTNVSLLNTYFTNNSATYAGEALYGGLLDRCVLSPYAEVFIKYFDLLTDKKPNMIIEYFVNITNLDISDIMSEISSTPIRLCFCRDGQPDCSYQPPTVYVMKGHPFNVSLVAVDQVNYTVPHSTIRGSLSSGHGRLSEGQSTQPTNESCTELQYNAFSPCDNETLLLYAEGPCNDTGISKQSIQLKFLPCHCPIGFEPVNISTECDCKCDSDLAPYITTECFQDNQTVLRKADIWFTFINSSNKNKHDIFVYPHCPFDYCYPPSQSVYVNLNIPDGSDAQCAFNRSGVLCGSCQLQEGLSLSLGSSCCMPCSNHWLALLIPFAIAGIVLVLFLSVLNLTVVVGTMNGLIFYANIVIANRAVFFQFNKPNFLSVFIAWLNLDFGFETCFYDGMDGYAKVWLQLVFPTYVIMMVAMVIIISEHSEGFSRFVHKINRNPVAVLATLILLSYAKLLRTIIAALSFTTLEYPDGLHETVWLYDANTPYFEGKHISLFIAALLILLVGVPFTVLLFLWQWLLKVSNWRVLFWLNNTRLKSFMDIYHAPYKDGYKYWTGLLLLARVLLYIISSLDHVIGDARVNLLSTICVAGGLLLLKEIQRDKTYKEHVNNLFESCFTFNLLIFASATYQFRETNEDQTVIAFVSISIAFITFVGIVLYHLWLLLKLFTKSQTITEVWHKITSFNRQQPRILLTDCNDSSLPETPCITDNNDLTDEMSLTRCTYSEMEGTPSVLNTDHACESKDDGFMDGSQTATSLEEISYTAINGHTSGSVVVESLGKHQRGGHSTGSKSSNDTIKLSMLVEDTMDDNDSTSEDETKPLLVSVLP